MNAVVHLTPARTNASRAVERLTDHGLPLVSLKELRRELVLAWGHSPDVLDRDKLHEIATVQQAIDAVEAVISDLDAELEQ
jgi:hypothetical protein